MLSAGAAGADFQVPQGHLMSSLSRLAVILFVLTRGVAGAQDVPGIELCTHETKLDRRTGCLQSNVEYLQGVITKNAAAAQQKLNAAAGDIAALRAEIVALKGEIAALKAAQAAFQAHLERIEAAAKPRPPEAPASKR
jgi:hypothetical protein